MENVVAVVLPALLLTPVVAFGAFVWMQNLSQSRLTARKRNERSRNEANRKTGEVTTDSSRIFVRRSATNER